MGGAAVHLYRVGVRPAVTRRTADDHAVSDRDSDCDPRARGGPDGHTDSHGDTYSDAYPDGYRHADSDPDAYRDCDPDEHADPDSHRDPDGNARSHSATVLEVKRFRRRGAGSGPTGPGRAS